MPGPPPLPTKLKELAGNPGKRPLNNDPEFTGLPAMPDWLNKKARKEWKRVVPDVIRLDHIRTVDAAPLASYCQSYVRWQQAEALLEAEGVVIDEPIVSKSGEVVGYRKKKHPHKPLARMLKHPCTAPPPSLGSPQRPVPVSLYPINSRWMSSPAL